MRTLVEAVGLVPLSDGVIVVGFILVLAVALSIGYAVVERYFTHQLDTAVERD